MLVGTRRALSAVLTPNARCNVAPLTLTLPLTGEVPIRGKGYNSPLTTHFNSAPDRGSPRRGKG